MKCEYCKGDHDGSYASGRFCCQACSRGFSTQGKRKSINNKVSKSLLGRLTGNALILKLKGYKEKQCKYCHKKFRSAKKCCSTECAKLLRSLNGKKSKNGGYKERAGTKYSGWYHGIYCNSSWELAFILYCEHNGKKIERNKKPFSYVFEGKERKYYPDFIVDGQYVEIKGLTNQIDLAKWEAFPHKLVVYGKKEFAPVLEFVKKFYGKDYKKLYERMDTINMRLGSDG